MGKITVVGTGCTADELTLGVLRALNGAEKIILHTARCGCADYLNEKGIPFSSLDALYDESEDFDEHIESAVETLLEKSADRPIVYGVLDVRDRTVSALCAETEDVEIIPGPPIEAALWGFMTEGTVTVAAADWEDFTPDSYLNTLIREIDTRELAGEIKLKLMDVYPEEEPVLFLSGGQTRRITLDALDRLDIYDHRTAVLVPAVRDWGALERFDAGDLGRIMNRLLAPGGCPWDRAQTHESLRPYMLEEAYEVIEAIDSGDPDHIADELGDMLYQIVFHAALAARRGEFTFTDVSTAICKKMLSRHTHIFGTDNAATNEEISDLWARNKMAERGQTTYSETLGDITRTLPATLRACKAHKKTDSALRIRDNAEDALTRAKTAVQALHEPLTEDALGEALLSLMNAARLCGTDPEIALNKATDRMIARFAQMEQEAPESLDCLAPEILQNYWKNVKLLSKG